MLLIVLPDRVANLLNKINFIRYKFLLLSKSLGPLGDDTVDVDILIVHEDHTHPRHRRRRCELQVVSLEYEINIGAKRNSLTCGEGQEVVVIKDTVESLDPLGVHITITNNPV